MWNVRPCSINMTASWRFSAKRSCAITTKSLRLKQHTPTQESICVWVCAYAHMSMHIYLSIYTYIYIWIKCMYVFSKTAQNHVKCGYGYGWCLMHIICPYPLSTVHYPLHVMPYAWSIVQYFMHYAYHMHIPIRIRIWICVCVCTYLQKRRYRQFVTQCQALFLLGIAPMEYPKEQWLFCQCFS